MTILQSYRSAVARLDNTFARVPRVLKRFFLRRAATGPVLAGIYYGLINREMSRESRAVAAGQLRYDADHKSASVSYFLLRRNIHRLEKGLIMRPRRAEFATDFIVETVAIYQRAVEASASHWNNELTWAHDVLNEYFAVVGRGSPKIAGAYARFETLETKLASDASRLRSIPYLRNLSDPAPISFDDFFALARRRRSVRWYIERPVPREMIDQALAVAGQSPSACNRQPFVFRIFDDHVRVAKIASIPMGTRGFSQNLPAVAVIVGQLRAYPNERDRHVIYIDGALAAMSFMFALETLGLSSVPINWPDQEPHESQMREELKLADDERVIMLIGFGWPDPDGSVPHSAKREVSDLRLFE
jgi:nitroreductase